MAKEVLYRRSFHFDGDLTEMEKLLELDQAPSMRKGITDSRALPADGGFEAPRNSLDVPFNGLLEARRNSEVRCEEIPIGYELSRSLTTRKRDDSFNSIISASDYSFLKLKDNAANTTLELDCKPQPRAPSVVARLMGLDALPRLETLHGSRRSVLRRTLQEESDASCNVLNASSRSSEHEVPVEVYSREKAGYGELSFRNHPQEKQLQEFKREFTARQALQGRQTLSCLNSENLSVKQKTEQSNGLDPQMDSEEFLDALDFLNANKDFFAKILSNPHSSFAKHLLRGGSSLPGIKGGTRQHTGLKISKCSSECNALSSPEVHTGSKKRQGMHQSGVTDKVRATPNLRWGRDDEMPSRLPSRATGASSIKTGGRAAGTNQVVPTRIVVLKPNLNRKSGAQSSCSSSPLLQTEGILKFRTECKQSSKEDVKLRMHTRNSGSLAKEHFRDDFKDGQYDARAIAKQIVKHVKEDISHRSSREDMHMLDSTGRRVPPQRPSGLPGDASGSLDREAVQRSTRDSSKFSCSLPNSPCASKLDRGTEHRQLNFNVRRGFQTEESKFNTSTHKQPSSPANKGSKEPSNSNEIIMQGNQGSFKKQNVCKESKPLKKTCRSNSLKARGSKCEVPRVLSRSLSAPAAPSVENRALESESRVGFSIERGTCSSRAKSSENSAFKERLWSLKDSFSLSKKKGSRKAVGNQCNAPLDSSELSTTRHLTPEPIDGNEHCDSQHSSAEPIDDSEPYDSQFLNAESVDGNKPCTLLPRCPPQAAPSALQEQAEEITENSLNEMLAERNLMTPMLPQWTSMTDPGADTASETSLDKGEQPSPVSVLETPFQEESPSSVDTRQDTRQAESKCHDFTCGRGHLKSDCKELPRNLQGAFFSEPSSCYSSFDSSTDESLATWNLLESHLESLGLRDIAFPATASEEELTYIMHMLSLSGLNVNGLVMAHSLSAEHGLNQSLFERLEAYYDKTGGEACAGQTCLNPSSRRLLFDVVDEVIASALKKRLSQSWTMSSNQRVLVCTGKQLVEQIFAHLSSHRFAPSQVEEEALEDMASTDLMREAPWVPSRSDRESILIELERLLCGDLIRELVHDLRR